MGDVKDGKHRGLTDCEDGIKERVDRNRERVDGNPNAEASCSKTIISKQCWIKF